MMTKSKSDFILSEHFGVFLIPQNAEKMLHEHCASFIKEGLLYNGVIILLRTE